MLCGYEVKVRCKRACGCTCPVCGCMWIPGQGNEEGVELLQRAQRYTVEAPRLVRFH